MSEEVKKDKIISLVEKHNKAALVNDGFEDAFVGMVERAGGLPIACYDYDKCVNVIRKKFEVSEKIAKETLKGEMVEKWYGHGSPYYLYKAS